MKKFLFLLVALILALPVSTAFAADIIRDRYYSEYLPTNYNDPNFSNGGTSSSNWSEYLQYRMNCYGYAMELYFKDSLGSTFNIYNSYKQQPGEFRKSSDASYIKSNITGNPSTDIANIISNMKYDASRLGYTVTEYTVPTTGIQTLSGTSRLIALVVGTPDYHYYMQHPNGTWSHKPGAYSVTNLSLDDQVPLTNSNIQSKANQGVYAGGALKFLKITKDAVTDYPHAFRATQSGSQTSVYFADAAGEQRVTASSINVNGSISGNFDFKNDNDVFYFVAPSSRPYVFTTSSNADIDGAIYIGNSSTAAATDSNTGNINMSILANQGETVYVKIWNYNKTLVPYTLNVTMQ